MNSINLSLLASLSGRCLGTTLQPAQSNRLQKRLFNMPIGTSPIAATGFIVQDGVDQQFTLAPGASTVFDLKAFTNQLGELTRELSSCILFYVQHDPASLASAGILVGNSGVGSFVPLGIFGATPAPLLKANFVILGMPNGGVAVAGGAHLLQVVNADLTNIATVNIGWWGLP